VVQQTNQSAEHSVVVNEILVELSKTGRCTVWKNSTGVAKSEGRYISFGLKGSSDIIGLLEPNGQFLAIEVKTGNAKQSLQQKKFEEMIKRRGGRYAVCRSVADALNLIGKEHGTS